MEASKIIVNDKIGLVLSGGGFRGVAHLGILQFMYELGVMPDEISGTSAGALVGAFIAEGYAPQEILEFCKNEKFFSYSDVSARNGGLFSTAIFEKIIRKYIPHDSFEGLKRPLYISVTDLTHARSLIFNTGSLSFAVKSSCCFPLVFQPVRYQDSAYLCDGGILNNFPVEQVRASCQKVVGVNASPINKMDDTALSYRGIVERIIRINTSSITKTPENSCDLYLQPEGINQYGTFDSKKIDALFQLGYLYAERFEKEFLSLKEN